MAVEKVRCVNINTGKIGFNLAQYAYDKYWNKSTGYYPQPEPKAEQFKSDLTQKSTSTSSNLPDASHETSKEEIKPKINEEITETITDGRRGRGRPAKSRPEDPEVNANI